MLIVQLLLLSTFKLLEFLFQSVPAQTFWPYFQPSLRVLKHCVVRLDSQYLNLTLEIVIIFSHKCLLNLVAKEKSASAKAEYAAMEKAGIIGRSNFP